MSEQGAGDRVETAVRGRECCCWTLCNSKSVRFILMLVFAVFTFIPMIILAERSHALVLLTYSYHLLSDMLGFLISLFAIGVSSVKKTSSNTFGWARAEVVGSLLNFIFLLALMFAVTVETIKHMIEPVTPTHPELILAMGILCLTFNTVGLLMFCGYRQNKHTVPSSSQLYLNEMLPPIAEQLTLMVRHTPIELDWHPHGPGVRMGDTSTLAEHSVTSNGVNGHVPSKNTSSSGFTADINMHGILIHVLRDASISLIICVYSVMLLSSTGTWLMYVNPVTSMVAILIITLPTFPLMKEASMILLQTVPENINVETIIDGLYKVASEILGVHEVHVWPLTGARIIATAHIQCRSSDYTMLSQKIKTYFHSIGIHSTTVQPEFVGWETQDSPESLRRDDGSDVECLLTCKQSCDEMTCCGTTPVKMVRFSDEGDTPPDTTPTHNDLSHDHHHHDNDHHHHDNTPDETLFINIDEESYDWTSHPRDSVYSKTSRNSLIHYESTV